MKSKNYKQKRKDLKEEKRSVMKNQFEYGLQRKKFVEGVKRDYRALKRSEKQAVLKQIQENVTGFGDEFYEPPEPENEWKELTLDQIKWIQKNNF